MTCLNFGEEEKVHPCNECLLWAWVPEQYRNRQTPCHFIPLSERGETIQSLEDAADRDRAEELLAQWLDTTIQQLEERVAKETKS